MSITRIWVICNTSIIGHFILILRIMQAFIVNLEGKFFMNYSERIRALREDNDLTQKNISQILYIAQSTYSAYELRRVHIPLDHLITLAKFYNVDMNYICGVSDVVSPFPPE